MTYYLSCFTVPSPPSPPISNNQEHLPIVHIMLVCRIAPGLLSISRLHKYSRNVELWLACHCCSRTSMPNKYSDCLRFDDMAKKGGKKLHATRFVQLSYIAWGLYKQIPSVYSVNFGCVQKNLRKYSIWYIQYNLSRDKIGYFRPNQSLNHWLNQLNLPFNKAQFV